MSVYVSKKTTAKEVYNFFANVVKLDPMCSEFESDWMTSSSRSPVFYVDFCHDKKYFHVKYYSGYHHYSISINTYFVLDRGINIDRFPKLINTSLTNEIIKMCKTEKYDTILNSEIYKKFLFSKRGSIAAKNLGLL